MDSEVSLYSQFDSHEAPQPKERAVNWQANRENTSKPYVNNHPSHVKEAMRIEQKDESGLAFWRLFTQQNPKGSFEQSVNFAFGELKSGFDFRAEKLRYITLYRELMKEL